VFYTKHKLQKVTKLKMGNRHGGGGRPKVTPEMDGSTIPKKYTEPVKTEQPQPVPIQKQVATEKITDKVFFIVQLGPSPIGRLVIGLYGEDVPKTVNNFKSLCTGNNTNGDTYKGSLFHRIIKGFLLQGGDFQNGDGTGGRSIFGETFEDENFLLKHKGPGTVSMANSGPNTNRSQFFITTGPAEKLDGKHVVFGTIMEGIELLEVMENVPLLGESGKPLKKVTIADCGILQND